MQVRPKHIFIATSIAFTSLMCIYGCALIADKKEKKFKKDHNLDQSCVIVHDIINEESFDYKDTRMVLVSVSKTKEYKCVDGTHDIQYVKEI